MPLLSAGIDDELSPEEARSVRMHLTACPACARRSELLRNTREAFRSLANAPAAGVRYAAAAALVTATLAAVTLGVSLLRTPRPLQEPPRSGIAADYCGVSGPNACVVEPPPCTGGDCLALSVPQAQ